MTRSYLRMGILELYYTKKGCFLRMFIDNLITSVLLRPLYNLLYNVKSGVDRGYFPFLSVLMRGF